MKNQMLKDKDNKMLSKDYKTTLPLNYKVLAHSLKKESKNTDFNI